MPITDAINPIKALARQAVSYSRSMAGSGIRTAGAITKHALGHGMSSYVVGGAAVGGALGAYNDKQQGMYLPSLSGMLRGAGYGAIAGAGLRLARSAAGVTGRRAMSSFAGRARAGMGSMASAFNSAGGMSSVRGGVKDAYRSAYGSAARYGARAARASAKVVGKMADYIG